MIEKNSVVEAQIVDLNVEGNGVAKINDYVIFVKDTVIGDVAKIKVIKAKKNYGFGRLIEIVKPSPYRTEAKCDVAHKCGGCTVQHVDYNYQLEYKRKKVYETIKRIGKIDVDVKNTIGMDDPYNYRNKAQLPVCKKGGEAYFGFYAKGSHIVIKKDYCAIQDDKINEISKAVYNFVNKYKITIYDEKIGKGLLRHLYVRVADEGIMVCLVLNGERLSHKEALINTLEEKGVTSIFVNVNKEDTNVILGDKMKKLWGSDYITDYIGDVKFNISPYSFYQVNKVQTKVLYDKVVEFANLKGDEVVVDAYCGIGTISLYLANKAKEVVGIEIIEDAIKDAKENAKINNIQNAKFKVGKAEDVIKELNNIDVLVVDPPRKGLEKSFIDSVINIMPEKIVYVSCDIGTLSRDVNLLKDYYEIKEVQPVDMFPQTTHVETVVKLQRQIPSCM